jgi:hypothetical protein
MMEQGLNQALSTDLPGLDVLFQNNPMLASMVAGKQISRADQNNKSLQEAFAAAEEQKRKERPLTLEQMAANPALTRAQTSLYGNQATGQGLANDITRGTMDSNISKTNSANATAMDEDKLKQAESMGQLYGQIAVATKNAPPMMRGQIVRQMMGPRLNQEHPEIDQFLMTHADTLPEEFAKMSKDSYDQTAAARKAASEQQMHRDVATTQAGATTGAARIGADSRVEVATTAAIAKVTDGLNKVQNDHKNQAAALNMQLIQIRRANPNDPRIPQLVADVAAAQATAAAMESVKAGVANDAKLRISALLPDVPGAEPGKVPVPSPASPTVGQPMQPQAQPAPSGNGPQPPATVRSDAEYNALPSGTQYMAPDDQIRVKK